MSSPSIPYGMFCGSFPNSIFTDFGRITALARDLNTSLRTPEVVLIGKAGCGKSSFLEAFLDIPYSTGRKERGTLRPIFLNLVNNQDCSDPRITVKRDTFLDEFARDVVITDVGKLAEVVGERNVESDVPIYLNIEWASTWNITFIDTPGILDPEDFPEDPVDKEALNDLILEYITNPERIVVAVENSDAEGTYSMADFARKVDPSLDRTIFVMSKLDKALEGVAQMGGSAALNRYLGSAPRAQTTFWCSFPYGRLRMKYSTRDLLLEKTAQMTDSDTKSLEELQFDRRFVNQFGVRSVRSFMVQLLWRRYQETIPDVLKQLQLKKHVASSELSRVSNMISNLDAYKLRAAASNYVMSFLQTIEKLVSGTLAGNPGQNGQTLLQEHSEENAGPWLDSNHQVIMLDPDDLDIPNADAKLYGGQQFARLLSEFRAVASTIAIGEISSSEIATASGPSKINNASNVAWAASDLAQKRCQRALMPLVEQLYKRASFILVRLADIVIQMLEKQAKADRDALAQSSANSMSSLGGGGFNAPPPGGGGFGFSSLGMPGMNSGPGNTGFASVLQAQMIAVDEFPYFVQHVKGQYCDFVGGASSQCKLKCLDEFYATRIIYWDLNSQKSHLLSDINVADEASAQKAVTECAGKLFDDLKERIVENVLLKCHNFFLVPMQTELWGDIQGKVTQLDDHAIGEMFQVTATREKYKKGEEKLREQVSLLQKQEVELGQTVTSFAHPIF